MTIAQAFVAEFAHEMKATRRMLEALSDDSFDFRPHERSMSVAQLAGHLAEIASWSRSTVASEEFDVRPVDGPGYERFVPSSVAETLAYFDRGVEAASREIAGVSDEAMAVPWTLKAADEVIFTMPRIQVLRTMILKHIIHHRGQLSVYVRLTAGRVPGMYGPSADEG